jgi:hypothetical protein
VLVGLCATLARVIYKYYLGVLAQGAQAEGSLERQDYDKLRAGLAGGNLAARLYTKWLAWFLDRVDKFFEGKEPWYVWVPRGIAYEKPEPLWTARSFDRCLLLALIYPIATIFLIWAISDKVAALQKRRWG